MAFKVTISKIHCKGCGLCIEVCSRNSLSLAQAYNQQGQPVAEFKKDGVCTGCRQCAIICPDAAIEIQEKQTRKKTSRPRRAADDDRQ